jgi:hypothetical protein
LAYLVLSTLQCYLQLTPTSFQPNGVVTNTPQPQQIKLPTGAGKLTYSLGLLLIVKKAGLEIHITHTHSAFWNIHNQTEVPLVESA